MTTSFPHEVRRLREQAGLSQSEAAQRCGVHTATWRSWEVVPTSEQLQRICEVLGCALDTFGDVVRAPRPKKAKKEIDPEEAEANAKALQMDADKPEPEPEVEPEPEAEEKPEPKPRKRAKKAS